MSNQQQNNDAELVAGKLLQHIADLHIELAKSQAMVDKLREQVKTLTEANKKLDNK